MFFNRLSWSCWYSLKRGIKDIFGFFSFCNKMCTGLFPHHILFVYSQNVKLKEQQNVGDVVVNTFLAGQYF